MLERLKELPAARGTDSPFPMFVDMEGSPGGIFVTKRGSLVCRVKSGGEWIVASFNKVLNESSALSAVAWSTKFEMTDQDVDSLLQTLD